MRLPTASNIQAKADTCSPCLDSATESRMGPASFAYERLAGDPAGKLLRDDDVRGQPLWRQLRLRQEEPEEIVRVERPSGERLHRDHHAVARSFVGNAVSGARQHVGVPLDEL